jgi:3-phosphoshikimate 1-carboxyvinyltransferase
MTDNRPRSSDYLDLAPAAGAQGTVQLPGSKSISNRILLLAALATGDTDVIGLLESDDTARMLEALTALGVTWERRTGADYRVHGVRGPFPIKAADLFLGNAGTAFRPLTATLALCGGRYRLSGVARMHERPIGDLVDALRMLGADIEYAGREGYPPLVVQPPISVIADTVDVRGDVSSQFLSALLMALPLARKSVSVGVIGELVSKPYVEITLALMHRFGVAIQREGWDRFVVPPGVSYTSPSRVQVEGDASSASYFLAAGAIGGGPVRVEGVGKHSIQGDVRFVDLLRQMGADVTAGEGWIEVRGRPLLRAFDADLNHIPDAAMTAAVLALFADGPCAIRNVANWRVKETDRLAAMATELRKLGATVTEGPDSIRIAPPPRLRSATIDTYDDHRIAMCFSLAAFGGVPVRINDPSCVNKTFPEYFRVFARLVESRA